MDDYEEMVDALFDVLEPGDLIKFEKTGQVRKVVDLLPSHLMWEDKRGRTSLISWRDFLSMREWEEENQPRVVKYYETREYKRASKRLEALLKVKNVTNL